MEAPNLIDVRHLSRTDGRTGRVILDGVNLDVRCGERLGLVGPTGSGKSSLLRSLALLDPIDEGSLDFRGNRVTGDQVPRYRRRVIYLSQRPAFVPGTVEDNLRLPFRWKVSDVVFDSQEAAKLLSLFNVASDLFQQSVESLSGGQQQIVACMRAMLLRPNVLLFDEATASLDVELTRRFEKVVSRWQSDKQEPDRSIVWTSHDPQQVRRLATRVMHIDSGQLHERSTP